MRTTVFISKATPEDDEFALWLAPRLEAEGYKVFVDITNLEAGEPWRRELTRTLQADTIKFLLCCRDTTLNKEGVQEEIAIAKDLARELHDQRFIIPLRLEPFKKLFGIGGLQYVDFVRGWSDGLTELVSRLRRQKVPCDSENAKISAHWEIIRRRGAIVLSPEPERLTSNWLRVVEAPECIRFFHPSGAVDRRRMETVSPPFPMSLCREGFLTFSSAAAVGSAFDTVGRFSLVEEIDLHGFLQGGAPHLGLKDRDASNVAVAMFRQAWEQMCRQRGLLEYRFTGASGFHVSAAQTKIGQKIPWGKQGERRSSMLRNVSRGHVWQYGVTGLPAFWPFFHFKLKSRVAFAPILGTEAGDLIDDARKQHRLRRSVCKGWRNKQWHGRMLAFLEMLSGDLSTIHVPLGGEEHLKLDAAPTLFTSPVSTMLPDLLSDEDEEQDVSTLGRPEAEDEA